MMLDHLGSEAAGTEIENAIDEVLRSADPTVLTPDVGGQGTTETLGQAIIDVLRKE